MINVKGLKINLYFCCATQDTQHLEQIEKHLFILKETNLINSWHRKEILPGDDINDISINKIRESDIIIFLLSPDFFNTDYIYQQEMEIALRRHENGLSIVLPIYVRYVSFEETPISKYEILPDNKYPITSDFWKSSDKAYYEIVKSLKKTIIGIRNQKFKDLSFKENQSLLYNFNIEKDEFKKSLLEKKLNEIYVNQQVVAPFDLKICIHPVIGSRKEPSNINWDIEKFEDINLVKKYHSLSKEFNPKLTILAQFNNEPYTLYIKPYAKFLLVGINGDDFEKGEVIANLKIPILHIITNSEKRYRHWSIARGESNFANVVTYQPNLKDWDLGIKMRLLKLDRDFGLYRIKTKTVGIISVNNLFKDTGAIVSTNDVLAEVDFNNQSEYQRSPVNGNISSWLVDNKSLLHKNQTICNI